MIPILQKCDVVALFSNYEGFPNSICEGLACGKPVLCTNVSDVAKFVCHKFNGFLCNADDYSTITEGFRFFLKQSPISLQEMGLRSREVALSNFQSNKIIEQFLTLFQS
jgi:glycosyltransferase involved in cell wall biosynthesis